jgi:hypothetical protein
VARSLEQKRNQHFTLSHVGQCSWKSVTTSIKQFIAKIAERKGIKLVVFIDVNSSFTILTEIGLTAAEKIIIPITEDTLHRNGFEYMFALLYGYSHPSSAYFYYRHLSFYYRANEYEIKLPKIHLILNKIANSQCDTSFKCKNNHENNELDWEFIFDLYKKHPQAFNIRNGKQSQLTSLLEFKNEFVIELFESLTISRTIKEAIKCHSPLLSVRSSFKSYSNMINSSINNISLASIGSITPKITRAASPQISAHNSINKKHVSYENDTSKVSHPFKIKQMLKKKNFIKKNIENNNAEEESIFTKSVSCASDGILENSNIFHFDETLEKIVDTLGI